MILSLLSGEDAATGRANEYIAAYLAFYARKEGIDEYNLSDAERVELATCAKNELRDDLYKNLDSLDNKASGILTFCGFAIAVLSLPVVANFKDIKHQEILNYLLFASLFAAILALSALGVRWSKPASLRECTLHQSCVRYYNTRESRTIRLNLAWAIEISSIIVASGFILLDRIL